MLWKAPIGERGPSLCHLQATKKLSLDPPQCSPHCPSPSLLGAHHGSFARATSPRVFARSPLSLDLHACSNNSIPLDPPCADAVSSCKTPLDPPCLDHTRKTGCFADAHGNASYGRLIHSHFIKSGADVQSLTDTHLVHMYCKCGCLEDACVLFDTIHPRHFLSTWNIIISTFIKHCRINEARHYFNQMLTQGYTPNKFTFLILISTCTNQAALWEGHQLHARAKATELDSDVVVGTALVNMYGKCGTINDVRLMFDSMPAPDVISWTSLISAYVKHGQSKLALDVFDVMQGEKIIPSKVTFVTILSACSGKDALSVGKELHAHIRRCGYESDVVIGNALLSMYGKCGSVDNARVFFDSMPDRDVISWNAIIAIYAQNGEPGEALCMGLHMHQDTLPDDVTFVSLLDACASLRSLPDGKRIHCCISCGQLEENTTLGNALVNMYGKCGNLEGASNAFETMHEHNEITWNALVSAYASKGQTMKALHLFYGMQQEGMMPNKVTYISALSSWSPRSLTMGKRLHASVVSCDFESDLVVGTAIVNMYGKSHSPTCARQVFDGLPCHNVVSSTAMISAYARNGLAEEACSLFRTVDDKQDPVLWNAMIAAFSQNNQGKKALALFEQMLQEGVCPDRVTFVSCFDAATKEAVLPDGKRLHSRIVGVIFEQHGTIQNALISMYGRCGSLEAAWELFGELQKRDVYSWSSMIAAHAQVGLGKEALRIFKEMCKEGIIPDKVTFINILSACSHAGLVHDACQYFASMTDEYSIVPTVDHYNCMIDLLGRSGRLDEVENMILNMRAPPNIVTWLTLLSACRNNVDVRRAEWAAECACKLDSKNATPYMILASI